MFDFFCFWSPQDLRGFITALYHSEFYTKCATVWCDGSWQIFTCDKTKILLEIEHDIIFKVLSKKKKILST